MVENPFNGRAKIDENNSSLIIEIPSKKRWFTILFTGVWLIGWAFGEVVVIYTLLSNDMPFTSKIFFLIWLIGWSVGGVFALYILLWNLTGIEVIIVEDGILTIIKYIKGFKRVKNYEIKYIKNLSLNPHSYDENDYSKNLFKINNSLKFDYGVKSIKFGNDLDEAEAKIVLEKLKNYLS